MGIAVSHRYCRCDVNLSLEKCDVIYVVCCPWRVMLLLLRGYASPDYAKWTILERDYATYYASVIRYATRAPSHFLGGLC